MIETECQQLIVQAVVEGGGRALKFNNRFLIGVCDLLLKMPGHQPMMLEAKLITLSPKTRDHVWDVGCTVKQKNFLRDWHEAGMLTGVVSFIQLKEREPIRTLRVTVHSYAHMHANQWLVSATDHRPLGDKHERLDNIRQQLVEFANG